MRIVPGFPRTCGSTFGLAGIYPSLVTRWREVAYRTRTDVKALPDVQTRIRTKWGLAPHPRTPDTFFTTAGQKVTLQYFAALRMGQKRVAQAREYLNRYTGGRAMPALALVDNKTNVWEPVGEENLYAFVDESAGFVLTDTSGYILAIVDRKGVSKALVQGVAHEQREKLARSFASDNVPEFKGRVILPI